jgi:hypothetical protein
MPGYLDKVAQQRKAAPKMPMAKKGGKITKTGPIKVHKDEVVLPASLVKSLESVMKKTV